MRMCARTGCRTKLTTSDRGDKRYCSAACRMAAYRARTRHTASADERGLAELAAVLWAALDEYGPVVDGYNGQPRPNPVIAVLAKVLADIERVSPGEVATTDPLDELRRALDGG